MIFILTNLCNADYRNIVFSFQISMIMPIAEPEINIKFNHAYSFHTNFNNNYFSPSFQISFYIEDGTNFEVILICLANTIERMEGTQEETFYTMKYDPVIHEVLPDTEFTLPPSEYIVLAICNDFKL